MINSFYKILSVFICIFFWDKLAAQESSIYENYYMNAFIINPAITGSEYYPVVDLSAKQQWVGFSDAPTTYLLAGNFRIGTHDFYNPKKFINKGPLKNKDRIGIGGAIYRDTEGPVSNTGGLLSYAYHIPLKNKNELSFGLSVIGSYHSINSSMLKPDQPDDNYLLTGNNSIFRSNVSFGVYYHNYSYFMGLSANKILRDISNDYFELKSAPSYYVIGGYKFLKKNISFNVEPSVVVKKLGDENISGDINLKLYVRRLNWVAFSYSTSNKMNFRFGLRLYKNLYVGYNFEQTLTGIAKFNYGSHEINIGINLGLIGIEGIRETVNSMDK